MMEVINDPSGINKNPQNPQSSQNSQTPYRSEKKVTAGILGIVLGGLGVHKFYLGYTTQGLIEIGITIVTCGVGSVIGLIEGILYLTKTDEEFDKTYVQGQKPWF